MTMQNANYVLVPEGYLEYNGVSGMLIDASGEKAAVILQVPKTGTITGFGFRVSTYTSTATPDCRIETVDVATGDPSGTLWSANTNGSVNVTATGWYNITLASNAAVTAGDLIAVVIVQADGAFTISDYSNYVPPRFPYTDLYTTTWTKRINIPNIALNYGGTYYPILRTSCASTSSSVSYNVDTATFDEYGNKFILPFACRIIGAWVLSDLDANADIKVYGSSTLSYSLDSDIRAAITSGMFPIYFASPLNVAANETIIATLLPTTTTNITISSQTVNNTAIYEALPFGSAIVGTKRLNAGAWTNETVIRYQVGLIIDQFSDNIGGGSGAGIWGLIR